jgi:predicted lipoprotein
MKRVVSMLALLVVASGLIWFFPLFHVVPLDRADASKNAISFDAAEFAEAFWAQRLVPALDQAADAVTVLAALRKDPQAARDAYGRAAGLGRARLYLLRGAGTIVSVEKYGIGVSLSASAGAPDIMLRTGLLFGNAVRDVTGLADAGKFSNSKQFNDVSAELNRIVEAQVVPILKRQAEVGRRIQFVGCAEIVSESSNPAPLKLIPLSVKCE